ncbi:hypothetical protein [Bradyrhizobium sp. 76]|uniref:hypothetical protein n=1 Tax=Bradyrhizobium sp. 76 TaxID=2782680 RepID=UPI001FFB3259|nr:hypothetical protein [Bradyrhizobium sp. 76]MCK1403942.1 hypothetical protein [Bradyrhizobium sp. 76]
MTDVPSSHGTDELKRACEAGRWNGCVGTTLVSETSKVRVWHLRLPAFQRFDFHRHVLNYFWTSLSDGRTRNYFEDGRSTEREVYRGFTMHKEFALGEYMLHSVENLGGNDLEFTTVEFLDSPNAPLPIPDDRRLRVPE